MRVINYEVKGRLEKDIEASVSAIGFFDGIHDGHKQLIKKAIKEAHKQNLKSSMITFSPSPASVLTNSDESLLTTVNERISIAEELGIDQFIILKFTRELSSLTPEMFHNEIIRKLKIKHIVCGEDFRYGFKGSGSIETLSQVKDLKLSVIKDYLKDEERISSTLIKKNISDGNVHIANEMLGYNYFIDGFVKHGRKKGRTIGFPTMNLNYPINKILLSDGIYIGITTIDNKNYISTINVGHNPTINTVTQTSVESFVHDFDDNTYDKSVRFSFIKKIRDELKFNSVEELINQMHNDIQVSEEYFDKDTRRRYNIETI